MKRPVRFAGLVLVACSFAGATMSHAASGGLDQPASVDRAARRIETGGAHSPEELLGIEVTEQVNAERSRRGLPPLAIDERVTAAALRHAADMAAIQRIQHDGSDGSTTAQRLTDAGYAWRTWGENVAAGFNSVETVVAGWMDSAGHRAILLGGFDAVGVAAVLGADGWVYWALVVAA